MWSATRFHGGRSLCPIRGLTWHVLALPHCQAACQVGFERHTVALLHSVLSASDLWNPAPGNWLKWVLAVEHVFSPHYIALWNALWVSFKRKNESMCVFFSLPVRMVFIDLILIGPTFCPTVSLEVCFVMALKMDCPHQVTASVLCHRKDRRREVGRGGPW